MKIHELKEKIDRQVQRFKEELSLIRTGRASPSLVENIKVDSYEGTPPLPIRELASISVSEGATITIHPWDLSLIPKIEKAIRASNLGFNPVVFDDLVRVPVPSLSEERRKEMARLVASHAEATKVEIRQIRQDEMRSIDEMEKNGVISEDERFKLRGEVEDVVHRKTEEVEKMAKDKESELLKI